MAPFEPLLLTSEIFSLPLFDIHLKVGKFLGIFCESGKLTKNVAQLRFLRYGFVAFMVLQFTICMAFYSTTFRDFDKGCLTWTVTMLFASCSCWVITIYRKRKTIGILIEYINQDLKKIMQHSDDFEKDLLKKTIKNYRSMYKLTHIFCIIATVKLLLEIIINTIISPDYLFVIDEEANFKKPIRQYMPYHMFSHSFFWAQFMPIFNLLFLTQFIAFAYTFAPSLMCYIPFKLDILAHRIETMRLETVFVADLVIGDLTEDELNYWRTKLCIHCIVEQEKTRWFGKELESFVKISIFVDFISISIQLCFGFYSMATATDIFPALAVTVVSFSVIWPYHSLATLIMDKCDSLRLAIYSCNWYDYPLSLQKLIYTMMYGLRGSIRMRAFFMELNQATFVAILRAGISFFNVIRSMT